MSLVQMCVLLGFLFLKMASDGDDERNDSYVANRHRGLRKNETEAEEGKWSERCIGFWQKDVGGKDSKGQQICTGINIIRINKKPSDAKMNLSQTRGIEIIIEEKAIINDANTNEDIGSDGMIGYQAPKIKSQKKDDQLQQQQTLSGNIVDNFKEKLLNFNNRVDKYQKDPAAITELLGECKEMAGNQFETGKRLLSCLKPSEKLKQMNTFVQHHFKDLRNWFDDKGGNG